MNETRGLWHGKRIDNREWVEGYYVSNGEDLHYIITDEFVQHLVDPSTLGECTGLTDKNGKLIFEGDIIDHNGEHYVIKYLEKYMRFSPTNHRAVFAVFDYTQSEIIGNIHDGGVGRD